MHNLDFSKGFAAIALAEHTGAAWHGYGAFIDPSASTEEWQRKAGADYTVIERPAFYGLVVDGKNKAIKIPNRKVLLRDDNEGYLATVGKGYEVFQPKGVFDFQREVIERTGAAVMETAGVLDEGRKLWTLSKLTKDIRVGDDDVLRGYLMACTSYDGTMASRFQVTTTRVVCENTLSLAISGTRNGYIGVPHSTKVDVDKVVTLLLEGVTQLEAFEADANHLAERKVSTAEAVAFIEAVLDNPFREKDGEQIVSGPAQKVIALFGRGQGQTLKSANGTAWGLVNAVTEYVDWNQRSKDAGTRFNSAQFGAGNERKQRAMTTAREMFLEVA